jgi:hypothetical protein
MAFSQCFVQIPRELHPFCTTDGVGLSRDGQKFQKLGSVPVCDMCDVTCD